ncbi:hypothetical protein ACULTK_000870 [Yersinia enterocolitica]|uniref:hypothetical protein n=1 Tax=Yersinia enterocolitica TaxID=630 RepID=UPI003867BE22
MNNSTARLRIHLYLRYNPTNYLKSLNPVVILELTSLIFPRSANRMHTLLCLDTCFQIQFGHSLTVCKARQ